LFLCAAHLFIEPFGPIPLEAPHRFPHVAVRSIDPERSKLSTSASVSSAMTSGFFVFSLRSLLFASPQ